MINFHRIGFTDVHEWVSGSDGAKHPLYLERSAPELELELSSFTNLAPSEEEIPNVLRQIANARIAVASHSENHSRFALVKDFAHSIYEMAGIPITSQQRSHDYSEFLRPGLSATHFVFSLLTNAGINDGHIRTYLDRLSCFYKDTTWLEVGPGKGYDMELLRFLGAHAFGIGPVKDCLPEVDRRIVVGKVEDCHQFFRPGSFDYAYSTNVFSQSVLDESEALNGLKAVGKTLKQSGRMFHYIHFESVSAPMAILRDGLERDEKGYLLEKSTRDEKVEKSKREFLRASNKERADAALSNSPSLSPSEYLLAGFEVETVRLHDFGLTILSKPSILS